MTKVKSIRQARLRDDCGQSFVEFAIVLPFLALLVFGIGQIGVALHNYLAITDAARAGARAAIVHPTTACAEGTKAIERTVSATQFSKSTISCSGGTSVGDPFTVSIT